MFLAVALGPSLLPAVRAFPQSVLGVLLAASGVELALAARDVSAKDDAAVMLLCAGCVLQLGTGAAFVAAMAAVGALRLRSGS